LAVSKMVGLAVKQDKAVKQAETFLASKHNLLNHLASVDDLVTNDKAVSASARSALRRRVGRLSAFGVVPKVDNILASS